jgi:nitrite reductase (NAD(P)H)
MPGGINYLKEVILEDKLGICADLEKQMEELVQSYFCEWTEVIKDPERRKGFMQFANTEENIIDTVEPVVEREQKRPAYWPNESVKEDFRGTKWSELTWQPIVKAEMFKDVPTGDSQAIKRGDTQLAIFKVRGKYYCTQQMCPHKRAFVLSDGLIGDDLKNNKLWVSCPYHKRNYELGGENAGKCANDDKVNIATFPVEERDDGWVYVKLPPIEELDSVLGTEKWRIKKDETRDPFEKLDQKLRGMKGRKGIDASHLNGGKGSKGTADNILAGQGTGARINGMEW